MRPYRHALLISGIAIASACKSAGGGSAGTEARPATYQDRNLILQEELQRTSASNMFDAIRVLRPQWLRERPMITGGRSSGQGSLLVYLDGSQFGDPTSLRQISVSIVQEVRFLSASEAQARYGTQGLQGVIVVTTRHR